MVSILDWKVDENADPLADVAYFMMVFLQPRDYGYQYKQLPKLLLGELFLYMHKLFSTLKAHDWVLAEEGRGGGEGVLYPTVRG